MEEIAELIAALEQARGRATVTGARGREGTMDYGDCYTLEEAEDVMDRHLDRIGDLEHQERAYSDEIDTLELRLIACQKELTDMQSQDDPMPCGHPMWALEYDNDGNGYCAWCKSLEQARAEGAAEERERVARMRASDEGGNH